jgi:flagellar biosynthesis/type III secretory pathway chaperone
MYGNLNKLSQLLDNQAQCLGEMADLCEQEKSAIIECDHESLDETNRAKTKLIQQLDAIEKERLNLFARTCRDFQVTKSGATVSDLIIALPEPHSKNLHQSAERLRTFVHKIRRQNSVNKELIRHGQGIVSGSISLITGMHNNHSVYRQTGKLKTRESEGMLLSGNV